MQFAKSKNSYVIRLEKDEEIIESLEKFCKSNAVKSANLWAIGAVLWAELGFYHLDKKEYSFKKLNSPLEIASLIGNVSQADGKPFLHIHAVFADENFNCIGGHLKEAMVGATCEVHLVDFEKNIERKYDSETGLKLLDCALIS